jgi:ABC-2 type transport system permease protein
MIREIVKHIRIYFMLFRLNVMSQMEYRANFITGIMMELGYMIVKVLYIVVAFRSGRSIAGFGPDEILVFVGTFITATGFYAGIFMSSFFQLSGLIKDGSFDTIMTKPISTLFFASFRRSDIGILATDILGGLVVTSVGLARLGGVDVWRILGYAFFLSCGCAVAYALFLMPMTLVFRVVNAQAIAGVVDSFWDFNNVPMIVYGKTLQMIGTYAIPMFVIASFPALFAMNRITALQMLWGALAPFVFISLARAAWNRGIKNYSSATG